MHTLNILSLNVNGLNSAVKRTRVLEYLHRKSISCALIQETHLKQSDVARFQNKYYKLAAFSCALNKTKGVLILVNRKLNLTIEHLGSDEKGRFVFIRCKIYNNSSVSHRILWDLWRQVTSHINLHIHDVIASSLRFKRVLALKICSKCHIL